jgi:hypothetical protein
MVDETRRGASLGTNEHIEIDGTIGASLCSNGAGSFALLIRVLSFSEPPTSITKSLSRGFAAGGR